MTLVLKCTSEEKKKHNPMWKKWKKMQSEIKMCHLLTDNCALCALKSLQHHLFTFFVKLGFSSNRGVAPNWVPG